MNSLGAVNWMSCQICERNNIHKNDYDKHCSSRRHKSNLMKQSHLLGDGENQLECRICNKNFINQEYFEIHLKGKVHKKAKIKQIIGATNCNKNVHNIVARSITSSINRDVPVIDNSKFRQKYKDRKISNDEEYMMQRQNYTRNIVAYLSIRLALDVNIQEFYISVNDKEWKSFGDIVIQVYYKNKNIIYAIKCKQITNNHKRIQTLKEAKIIMDKEYRSILGLDSSLHIAKFAIFTACTASSKLYNSSITVGAKTLNSFRSGDQEITEDAVLLVKPLTKRNEIINTTMDCENIFTFYSNGPKNFLLPSISLYTNQVDHPEMIRNFLKTRFGINTDISLYYLKYIDCWSIGNLGGNFKLQKRDVILTLGELLLDKYIGEPKMIHLMHESFEMWNTVTHNVDLIVVGAKPMIISKMCQPINQTIEDTFNIKIDTISRTINLKDRLDFVTDPKLKAYLFEEVDNFDEDIPLREIYRVLWKADLAPLLLNCQNFEEDKALILDVITLMRAHRVHKKFLLETKEPDGVRTRGNMKIFRHLDDIKEFVNLDDIHIRVKENFQLSLKTLQHTDKFLLKWITPEIFFDLTLKKYSFKPNNFGKTNCSAELKIILDISTINEVEHSLYGEIAIDNVKKHNNRLHHIDPMLF